MFTDLSKKEYKTDDIYEASYLMCNGMKRKGKVKQEAKWLILFENYDECERLSLDYYDNKTNNVNAKEFANNYRIIKRYLFQ